jgi:enoyl-[acyl-carrier protein] reductase II
VRAGRPFAVNHQMRPFNEEACALALKAKPKVVSIASGDPDDLAARIRDAGILLAQHIRAAQQAYRAAEKGVDVIVAQGSNVCGSGGPMSAMSLLPRRRRSKAPPRL